MKNNYDIGMLSGKDWIQLDRRSDERRQSRRRDEERRHGDRRQRDRRSIDRRRNDRRGRASPNQRLRLHDLLTPEERESVRRLIHKLESSGDT